MVLCTKLLQWLSGGTATLVLWWLLVAEILPLQISPSLHEVIVPVNNQDAAKWKIDVCSVLPLQFPVYLVVCYGVC